MNTGRCLPLLKRFFLLLLLFLRLAFPLLILLLLGQFPSLIHEWLQPLREVLLQLPQLCLLLGVQYGIDFSEKGAFTALGLTAGLIVNSKQRLDLSVRCVL